MIDLLNPYAWIMRLRRWLYGANILRSVKLGTPVISVGNLSSGGTGKTPFTMYLVRLLRSRYGLRCAIVLRGYKRDSSGLIVVRDWDAIKVNTRRSGDEAQLYARELEGVVVICDEDRVRGARMAREMGAEVVILDDGFQHLRLRRDLNIVLINALEGIPHSIPFGKGREGIGAIGAFDLVAITNYSNTAQDLTETIRNVQHHEPITVVARIVGYRAIGSRTTIAAADLEGKRVLAVSGIGTPEGFEQSLRTAGAIVVPLRFSDHAAYDEASIDRMIVAAAGQTCDAIVTTTKDEVKLIQMLTPAHRERPIYVAQSQLDLLDTEPVLLQRLDALFQRTT